MSVSRFSGNNVIYLQIFKLIFVFVLLMCLAEGDPTRPKKSNLKYINQKYVKHAEVTTYRRKKSEFYATNVTTTTLHTWGSNVTMQISYTVEGGKIFKMSMKLCEMSDKLWIVELMRLHSNVTDCPQPANTYVYYDLVTIPKVLPPPLAIPKTSTGCVDILYFLTATKEKIMEFQLIVRVK